MAANSSSGRTEMCAIAVEKRDDFCVSPPYGFHLDQSTGKMKCVDNSVLVLVRDTRFEGRDVNIEVDSLEDVDAIRKLMFKKPILTTAHCHQTVSEDKRKSGSDQFVMLKTVDYVVLINTLHPLVQDQLEMAFQSAEELLKERKNFRITIAFSDAIRNFVENEEPENKGDYLVGETHVWNCDLIISHGVSRPKCADHFFACKNTCQTSLWCFCFPCCLLTGFPYLLYRKFIIGWKDELIKASFPVTYHDGPFLVGFDILSLLYPPKHVLSATSQYTTTIPTIKEPRKTRSGSVNRPYQGENPKQLLPSYHYHSGRVKR